MIVALDATYSLDPQPSGIAVYSRELLSGLATAHPDQRFRFLYRPHRLVRGMRNRHPPNARVGLLWNGWVSRSADLFHALNQRVDSGAWRHVVSTFHDLFVMTGEYSTPEFRARFSEQARRAAQRSDLIIAVSRFTASQVTDLLGIAAQRIRVVPHGVRLPPVVVPQQEREKLILFVGAVQKRKNVTRLVRAFEGVGSEWRLVLAGSHGYGAGEAVEAVRQSPRRNDIDLAGYVSAEQLRRLWSRAAVLAFPSLDEGFGIPVLEAMANGVAAVVSNRAALPEVAGDAALYVDPFSSDSIADALRQITSDVDLRTTLAERGRARATEFSWNKTVERTWAVYRELLEPG
ncbi:MAG TPA: glycosyltransferase family 1 protein [Bryobacteraceae bacterium]|nr:glycosyltransferase family 1 protein [Bryobacteraceae bacterium]